jgi:hypothetical protein
LGLLAATACGPAVCASTNLVTDGDFTSPFSGGPSVDGWQNDNGDVLEINPSFVYGLPCVSAGCLNLEVNANETDTVDQMVSGLVVGDTYTVSWEYGGRAGGGPQQLDVSFGGVQLATETGSYGAWTLNRYVITATDASEDFVFQSIFVGGDSTFGNEITDVAVNPGDVPVSNAVPEPDCWAMMLAGLFGVGTVTRSRRSGAAAVTPTA